VEVEVRQSSTSAQWKSQTPMAADAACGSWKCTASAGWEEQNSTEDLAKEVMFVEALD